MGLSGVGPAEDDLAGHLAAEEIGVPEDDVDGARLDPVCREGTIAIVRNKPGGELPAQGDRSRLLRSLPGWPCEDAG
jgi:hypothetical protein